MPSPAPLQDILNYINNSSTDAAGESFAAKTKAFRSQFRGVKNAVFFLYQLTAIFAPSTIFGLDPKYGYFEDAVKNKKPANI